MQPSSLADNRLSGASRQKVLKIRLPFRDLTHGSEPWLQEGSMKVIKIAEKDDRDSFLPSQ